MQLSLVVTCQVCSRTPLTYTDHAVMHDARTAADRAPLLVHFVSVVLLHPVAAQLQLRVGGIYHYIYM